MISIATADLDLSEDEQSALSANLRQLNAKQKRSVLREAYYDGKRRLDRLGISIPPQMKDLDTVVGWPAKTCDALSSRLHLGGFVLPNQSRTDSTLADIFALNRMSIEWPQAQVSTFIHGAAFGAVTVGGDGEPPVLISMMPATEATGIWDVRRRGLSSALWAPAPDPTGAAKAVLFMADENLTFRRDTRSGKWSLERTPNPLPRVAVTPLSYRRRMGRPFGMSRISRAVMSLTDQAVRTMVRTEVSADFYNAPQRYLMGADDSAFVGPDGKVKTQWEAILGRIWAVGRDQDGNLPVAGEFTQASMEPNVAHLRMIAMMFCGETHLPASSVGIIHDNPASAEAIDAAWADMVGIAELCQEELGSAAVEIAQNALMLDGKKRALPRNLVRMRAKWRNASTPTRAAMTDAATKQIAVGSLLPHSEVALEQMGYDQTDIERIQAEHAAAMDPKEIAARAEAMKVLVDSGATPESAARTVGLQLKFSPAPAA